ncbi:phage antirepressor KilAC domain-containing protein [Streptomyces sp. DSM 41013]
MNPTMMHRPHPAPDHAATASSSPFDALRRVHQDGTEFWTARDLMTLMGYPRWRDFRRALERAMSAAQNTGLDVAGNFRGSPKVSGARGPSAEDYDLTRHAAYLVAMNGDPNKREVAAAQAYFAVRTRQAETTTAAVPAVPQSYEDALAALLGSVRAQRQAEERAAELEPKAAVHDRFLAAERGDRLVRQAAKELGWRETDLRGFLLAERLIYQRQRPCGGVEYDFYAGHADHFATSETLVRHNHRPGDCAHYTLYVRPAGLALIHARIGRRLAGPALGSGWNPTR